MVVVVEHDDAAKATVALHTGEGMMNRMKWLGEPWQVQDPESPDLSRLAAQDEEADR